MNKVVVLGGGTGLSFLVKGLKDFPLDLTCVISVSDDGSSTGKLRKEFLMPAVGDIRKVLSNMSTLSPELQNIMENRFKTKSDLDGHAVGNLLLTSLYTQTKSLRKSIKLMSELLDVKKKVLPLSEDYLTLVAEMEDGTTVEGEHFITESHRHIKSVHYKEEVEVLPEVLAAIKEADLIILSIGSLYTSVIPNLIPDSVKKAIDKSKGEVLYVANAMTEPGETDKLKVSDHINILNKYLGKKKITTVVASNTKIDKKLIKKYQDDENKDPVKIDKGKLKKMNVNLIESSLITTKDGTIKHDSLKLSALIFAHLMR